MPWKNRYIGNPVLTGVLNLLFRSRVDDAHCGLRAITRDAFLGLQLNGQGMEFASEMVVKASLKHLRIVQTPATLSVDLRDRPPHLRPWRDGWRHLRYLMMLSPTWTFGAPALAALSLGALILAVAALHGLHMLPGTGMFGASWAIGAGFLVTCGHFTTLMAIVAHVTGVRAGYRLMRPSVSRLGGLLRLETMLLIGVASVLVSLTVLTAITVRWGAHDFVALPSVLPLVLALTLGATGMQTIFGAFLVAIAGGHNASFASDFAGPRG